MIRHDMKKHERCRYCKKRLSQTQKLSLEYNALTKQHYKKHPKIAEQALLDFCRVVIGFRMMTHPKNVFNTRERK